ncbi:single-stranded-DNA-specific exonuclease RecJ [Parahaliea mediterranea]|uniref:single-stranded-DNA-specific exonuclease RecJ n=1 Tax=Parahaliea mediterranea TaxID=651086 RepID=UPI001F4D943B|nr:single-stranded-DNA-specific exonuclease RecJ [Parahaliea mediterranea]
MRRRAPGADFSAPGLHPLLGRVYRNRGVASAWELELGLAHLLPPAALQGAEAAGALLADAIAARKKLLIVGDFDADGATSTALAVTTLRRFGAAFVDYLVPNRFDYGYGLTPEIVELAAQRQPDLIITVDNGISSIEGVAAASAHGIDTLVTDHHLAGRALPAAAVIVNPNQPGCGFPSKALAGVGVIFYVMLALRAELRRRDWFTRCGMREPNMAEALDLVALGTVADVVPLDHNNRILVDAGLRRIRAGEARPGILALLEVAGRRYHNVVASDLGFAAGPRLNAAGRLDDMSIGIECLLSEDAHAARRIAAELHQLNQDRRTIERGMERQALEMLAALDLDAGGEPPLAMTLFDPDWHQGVIGILASRVKDRLHRPTIAFANADAAGADIKGSARSIQGIHIRDVLDAVATRHPGLISKFGGHAMAAGLSLPRAHYEDFSRAFVEEVARHASAVDLQAIVESDGELAPADFDLEAATALRYAGPWGQHFPEPLFDGHFRVVSQRIVGERHLKLVLGLPGSDSVVDAIAFNVDTEQWPDATVDTIEAAYRLDVNEFRGQHNVQLVIEFLQRAP